MRKAAIVFCVVLCCACASKSEPKPSSKPSPTVKPDTERPSPDKNSSPRTQPSPKDPTHRAMPVPLAGPMASSALKAKVDCERMCKRTFEQCVSEVLISSGKISAQKMAKIKEAMALPQVRQSGYRSCLRDCKKKRGFGSDAAEINKCLGLEGCQKYADCIKIHIK